VSSPFGEGWGGISSCPIASTMTPILVNDYHAGLFIERQAMIEITNISERIQIYYVGKEGENCHCFRLKSNNGIVKIRRYSTEYPYDLIDTKGGKQSNDGICQQVSLNKKTNTEKSKTKPLISWRLFERQWKLDPQSLRNTGEYEDVYYDGTPTVKGGLDYPQKNTNQTMNPNMSKREPGKDTGGCLVSLLLRRFWDFSRCTGSISSIHKQT